jgi:hypothetical protein
MPSRPDDEHPLDDLFVVGAQYHEPSAAERAKAARDAQLRAQREEKERAKRVKHTRRTLEGGGRRRHASSGDVPVGGAAYDRKTALIGLGVIVAVATVLAQTGVFH